MSRLLLEAIGFLAHGGWKLDNQLDEARRKADLCVWPLSPRTGVTVTAAVVRGLLSPSSPPVPWQPVPRGLRLRTGRCEGQKWGAEVGGWRCPVPAVPAHDKLRASSRPDWQPLTHFVGSRNSCHSSAVRQMLSHSVAAHTLPEDILRRREVRLLARGHTATSSEVGT